MTMYYQKQNCIDYMFFPALLRKEHMISFGNDASSIQKAFKIRMVEVLLSTF